MRYKKWFPATAVLLLIVLLWVLCNGRGERYWGGLQYSRLVFENGPEVNGENYGIMNTGPALSLPGGAFSVLWDIEGDGENAIRITTSNNAAFRLEELVVNGQGIPTDETFFDNEIPIPAGRVQGIARMMSLDEIYDLQIAVDYREGSYIRVGDIAVRASEKTDAVFTATFLLLALFVLLALHAGGFLTPQRRGTLVILTLAVLVASIPDLRGPLQIGHDSEFHMGRLLNLVHALRDGQFPVRIGAYLQNGYGAILSAFYPELFLYIPALMICAGASFTYSYHVFFILMNLAAALCMWFAASRMFKSEIAGTACAVLYTLSQYRLMNIYTRFAIGESLAMSFLPLFALGLYEVLLGDKRRWKLLAVSALLICQSHMLTTAACGVAAVGLGLVCMVRVVRERRVVPVLLAIVFAAALNAFFFCPMLTYRTQNLKLPYIWYDLMEQALAPAQLFLYPHAESGANSAGLITFSVGLGLPLIVMAGAAMYIAVTREKRTWLDMSALLLCSVGIVFSLMATRIFPWNAVNSRLGGVLSYLQFPWRMLVYASLCFALAGGYAIMHVKDAKTMQFVVLALCAMCALPLLSEETRQDSVIAEGHLPYWDQRFGDYSLPNSKLNKLDVREPVSSEGVEVTRYRKVGTSIDAHVTASKDGTLTFPLYAFDGYEVLVDGKAAEVEFGEYDHMMISLQAGTDAPVSVRYVGKAWWRIGDVISLMAAVVLSALTVIDRKRNCQNS